MTGITTYEIHERHMARAQEVVRALTEAEKPIPDLSGIWLFGSVTRNQDTEHSDVDIVVTHNGPEESFPFAFLNAVCEALEKAQIPQRPKSRRSQRFPGWVQIETRSEALFQNPSLIRDEDVVVSPSGLNTIRFWEQVRADAVKLWPA